MSALARPRNGSDFSGLLDIDLCDAVLAFFRIPSAQKLQAAIGAECAARAVSAAGAVDVTVAVAGGGGGGATLHYRSCETCGSNPAIGSLETVEATPATNKHKGLTYVELGSNQRKMELTACVSTSLRLSNTSERRKHAELAYTS